ncbi:conserved Plasmodium protein, unknown function [Plasmodium ovale curtisi]|uniref:Uncharacterized protein n=1 Tax=Plasmodium ovale curtisi TaxID=864141 RepID=A0A1A8W3K0_PLAOA|nr:conserved Plasmodium protein, unknown function [Plasmodium ovale curtisi]
MDPPKVEIVDGDKIKANDICLQLKSWGISKEDCEAFFQNKKVMHFKDYISKYDDEIKKKKKTNVGEVHGEVLEEGEKEIAVICTIVNIPYQVRKYNNEKFVFWDISDLKDTQSRLFLTGEICEVYENVKEGAVLVLVNAHMKDKDPQYYNSRLLEIHDKKDLKIIGTVDKLEKCKGRKRNGESCKIILYTPLFGHYCKYHIKQDRSKKKKKGRGQNVYKEAAWAEADTCTDIGITAVTSAVAHEEGKNEEIQLGEENKLDESSVKTDSNKKNIKKKKKKKKKEEGEEEEEDKGKYKEDDKNGADADGSIMTNNEKDESFDVDSIIGMYTNKIVVKDKKKKMELINNRIKELDDYSKQNNEAISLDVFEKMDVMTTKEEFPPVQKSINDIFSEQCPELVHLIDRSMRKSSNTEAGGETDGREVDGEEYSRIKAEAHARNHEMIAASEEKQKKKFESFLSKLVELQKSKEENDAKTLIKGLTHVTNNFHFNLKHINNSNIVDVCYKLMDHRSEEVAIAALKFKRKINRLYIDYYKYRVKRQKIVHTQGECGEWEECGGGESGETNGCNGHTDHDGRGERGEPGEERDYPGIREKGEK